ncbi:hypothetical protein H8F21_15695 [Pseudomonas sp. P66]|uniref:Uncharacterized protein n=1 Tax=Pseudomonas arcuscaelestis TaxID=2710591 RepID=A0ABS2BZG5_9PSED|nr:hypothetical protein [Pseudomonas arcuscaelestis]MBM5459011.1 hypothetical protein [Pseudomonas arcuscaelestis]
MAAININEFPAYFRAYKWSNANHASRGYPGDAFPGFPWIKSLEDRGARMAGQQILAVAPTDYIREILSWGAGKNDPSMKFEAGLGNVALIEIIRQVIAVIDDPRQAISTALQIPGFGLTYASKLLRFLRPETHASLDRRIRVSMLKAGLLSKIHDSYASSMVDGYVEFQSFCARLCAQLEAEGIQRPGCMLELGPEPAGWRVADVEMALFAWADTAAAQRNP